jgi:uncharacterized membrane protein (UPF0182 family)
MAGEDTARFSLTTTFAPVNRETLAAFMAVNSDATNPGYGQIRALALPRNTTFPGPSQMQNKIESDQNVSDELLALRRGGSAEVELGNLLTLPVAGGLMYVEPVYARATEGASYPTLRKVIVSFGDQVAITDSYADSLAVFFAGVSDGGGGGGGGGGNGGGGGGTGGNATAQQQLENALADAAAAYERGQEALATGDFAAYGEAQQDLAAALERAQAAAAELGLAAPPATPEGTSPEATPSPSPSESVTPASQSLVGTPGLAAPASTP